MAYAATAGDYPSSATAAPGVLALQRALVWLAGASIAIVFVEPSPYELVTLTAIVVFCATGLRLRLLFMPLLLLLVLINLGYSMSAVPLLYQSVIARWIPTPCSNAPTLMSSPIFASHDT